MDIKILFLLLSPAIAAELRFVAIVYRHGDRAPVKSYPNDPWNNKPKPWFVELGQLTNRGKQQHYALGQWLKYRYSNLISEQFDPKEVNIFSTDVDRTLMSAQSNLAGMFPPINTSVWNPDLNWQPIPVHTTDHTQDAILAMEKPCPAYDRELNKYYASREYRKLLLKYKPLLEYLTSHTGMQINTLRSAFYIYDILLIQHLYGLKHPEWTKKVYPDALLEVSVERFHEPTATPLLKKLLVSPFLKHITSLMQNVTQPNNTLKMQIFSAHDDTIADILNSLNMYNSMLPPYTSTLFFELYSDEQTNEEFIKILYRNSSQIVEPHVLEIPNCGETCPFVRFKKLYSHMLNIDWDLECKIYVCPEWLLTFAIIICLAISFLLMFGVARNFYLARTNLKQADQLTPLKA